MVGRVVVVGGGPGGLMAAEQLAMAGATVSLFERMPSVGRKFLLAGRGGLNLTHSESPERMLERYGDAAAVLAPVLRRFDPAALRAWAAGLGEPTFVGSSGRVFPESFRATPLLRAWLARLDDLGVEILTRRHWTGLTESGDGSITLEFRGPDDVTESVEADAVVLAMGGASWPKVGSDASWVDPIERLGVDVSPLRPANCGFVVPWTDVFRERFAGTPLKNVTLSLGERSARGEAMITETGVEGGVFYVIGAPIRDLVIETGVAVVTVDLQPDLDASEIAARAVAPTSEGLVEHGPTKGCRSRAGGDRADAGGDRQRASRRPGGDRVACERGVAPARRSRAGCSSDLDGGRRRPRPGRLGDDAARASWSVRRG